MGFPKKDKLDKPGFDPVVPENAEVSSEYAKKFEEMPVKSMSLDISVPVAVNVVVSVKVFVPCVNTELVSFTMIVLTNVYCSP